MTDETTIASTMPFRVLVDEAMKLWRRHFRRIYLPVAIPVALTYAALTTVQVTWMRNLQAAAASSPAFAVQAGCIGVVAAFSVVMIAQTLAYTAVAAACVEAIQTDGVNMARIWRFALQPRVLGTLVLVWMALAIAFLFLFFPAIYVGLILSLVAPVMAAEGVFGFAAMRRSSRLVRYNPQKRFLANPKVKVFALFVIAAIISYAVGFVVQLPFIIFQGFNVAREFAGKGEPDPGRAMTAMLWSQVPSSILSSLVSTAIGVYTGFGLALLYFDIRRRKEGMDLEAEIDRMSGPMPEAPPPITPA